MSVVECDLKCMAKQITLDVRGLRPKLLDERSDFFFFLLWVGKQAGKEQEERRKRKKERNGI